jgi:hypothetical protein
MAAKLVQVVKQPKKTVGSLLSNRWFLLVSVIGLAFLSFGILFFVSRSSRENSTTVTEKNKVSEAKNLIQEELGKNFNNWPLTEEFDSYHLWCVAAKE